MICGNSFLGKVERVQWVGDRRANSWRSRLCSDAVFDSHVLYMWFKKCYPTNAPLVWMKTRNCFGPHSWGTHLEASSHAGAAIVSFQERQDSAVRSSTGWKFESVLTQQTSFVIRESWFFLLDNSKKAGSFVSSSAMGFMSSLQKIVLNILKKGKVPWQIGVELLCPLKFHSDLRWRDTAIVTT